MPSISVSSDVYTRLVKRMGEIQMESGKPTSINDVVADLLDNEERLR